MASKKQVVIDAEQELRLALRKSGCYRRAGTWFQTWPSTRRAATRLAGYLGNIVPAKKGRSLLEQCLIDAFNLAREPDSAPSNEANFLTGLLQRAPELLKVRIGAVIDDGDLISWDPMIEPLSTFLENARAVDVRVINEAYCNLPDDQVRLLIAVRILDVSEIERIGIERLGGKAAA